MLSYRHKLTIGFKRKRNIVLACECWALRGFDGRADKWWQTSTAVPEGAGVSIKQAKRWTLF